VELLVALNSLLYNHILTFCEDSQCFRFIVYKKDNNIKERRSFFFRSCSFSTNQEIKVDIEVLNKARAVGFIFSTFVCLRANKATHKQIFTDNIDV